MFPRWPPSLRRERWEAATGKLSESKLMRVARNSDFRLLWIGAFLSFTGSWIQTVAQGNYVFELTHEESKLALVSFCSSLPVFLFGLAAGSLADMFNRRVVLIVCQSIFAAGALYLAAATYYRFVEYWHIVLVALLLGLVSAVEMPTRQSVVSRVVPPEDLAAAVPVNAMTFNVARIFGPAIGGLLLASVGVPVCYLLNGISFLALIWAALAIKANLRSEAREPQPIWDLVFEGFLYTFRDVRLKTLFFLEALTATFGLFYLTLLPAYVEEVLGLGKETRLRHALHLGSYEIPVPTGGVEFALRVGASCVLVGAIAAFCSRKGLSNLG